MLELEEDLEEEPAANGADMTPFEAFELLVSHLLDGTAEPLPQLDLSDDWVGHCASAGLGPNNDAQMFLQIWKPIKILWQVRTSISYKELSFRVCVAIRFVVLNILFVHSILLP